MARLDLFELPLREAVESVSFTECHQVTARKMRMMMMMLTLLSVVAKFQVLQVGSIEILNVSHCQILLREGEWKNFLTGFDGLMVLFYLDHIHVNSNNANIGNCKSLYPAQLFSADNSRLALLNLAPWCYPGRIPQDLIAS